MLFISGFLVLFGNLYYTFILSFYFKIQLCYFFFSYNNGFTEFQIPIAML